MDTIDNILADYEKLIKMRIQIPLDNGDIINFSFHAWDLPHLLGLQHLVDIPVFFEYNQKRISAQEIYKRLISQGDDKIDSKMIEGSSYYNEVYETRIKYFSSDRILDIIQARQLVKFDPKKIKNFETKLENIEYMFWKRYRDENNKWGYFGIGFMSSGKKSDKNYPNTFFFRVDDDYIINQELVLPLSFMKINKAKEKEFHIYWDEVFRALKSNPHYKKIKRFLQIEEVYSNIEAIESCSDPEVQKHYDLLKLDALHSIYVPFMDEDFRWTNDEKKFIYDKLIDEKKDLLPSEVRNLLNEYRQMKVRG